MVDKHADGRITEEEIKKIKYKIITFQGWLTYKCSMKRKVEKKEEDGSACIGVDTKKKMGDKNLLGFLKLGIKARL